MKGKCFFIALGMLFVLNSDAQSVVPYEKWIDKDTCWIFNSFRSIGTADGDTICVNEPYQLTLPKTIRRYGEIPNGALFVLKNNQYVFVRRKSEKSIVCVEECIDIETFISFFDNLLTNKDKRIISKVEKMNKKRKKVYLEMKNGINILLYNFKEEDLRKMVLMIESNM